MAPNGQHSVELTPDEVEALKGDYKSSCGSIAERFQVEDDVSRKSKGWRKLIPNLPIMLAYLVVVVAGTGFWIAKERGLFGLGTEAQVARAIPVYATERALNNPHEASLEQSAGLPVEPEELATPQPVAPLKADKPASAREIGTGGKLATGEAKENLTTVALPEVTRPQVATAQFETAQEEAAKAEALPTQTESVVAKPTLDRADEQSSEQTLALIKQGEYLVQLASVRKLTLVEAGWKRFQASHEDLLSDLALHTEEADVAGKTFYRIQTGPFASKAEAIDFCGKLKARDQDCFVTKKAK